MRVPKLLVIMCGLPGAGKSALALAAMNTLGAPAARFSLRRSLISIDSEFTSLRRLALGIDRPDTM